MKRGLTELTVPIEDGFKLFEYSPTVLYPFFKNYEPLTLQRRVRFFFELLKGYKVYYLAWDDKIVAYCVISRGGGRYHFAGKEDIVVGPYYVLEQFRGHHYSEVLVSHLLNDGILRYRYAFDWIRYDNIPSLRCADRVGFVKVESMDMVGLFRRLTICTDHVGDYWLFKYYRIVNEDSHF